MDLLGSDLPVEGEKGMKFAWSDGILLQVGGSLVAGVVIDFSLLKICLFALFRLSV